MRTTAAVILAVVFMAGPTTPGLMGQAADTTSDKPGTPFLTRNDLALAAAFAAGTVALTFTDRRLAHTLQEPSLQENSFVSDGASFFRFMGEPAPEIAGLAAYGVGRFLLRDRHVAALGLHGLEALMLSTAVTGSIKMAVGRARPYVRADSVPFNFGFMRGFDGRDYQSFPSGHTAAAFSVAASTTAEMARWADEKNWWPGWKYVIGATMYGGAGLVGLSRMYHDQHWASDVIAGAAVGTFSGIKTVTFAYRHPQNRIDRWLLPASVMPAGNGALAIRWVLPAPR